MKKTFFIALLLVLTSSLFAQAPPAGDRGEQNGRGVRGPARGGAAPATPAYEVQSDRTVVFRLRAPDATAVQVTGDFGSATTMAKGPDGTWSATVGPLRPAIYNYAFTVNGVRILDLAKP